MIFYSEVSLLFDKLLAYMHDVNDKSESESFGRFQELPSYGYGLVALNAYTCTQKIDRTAIDCAPTRPVEFLETIRFAMLICQGYGCETGAAMELWTMNKAGLSGGA
jgi:hypothetical protein